MTDRELLECAAKAAGINRYYYEYLGEWGLIEDDPESGWWNPLTDDGDALRLAVMLKMDIRPSEKIQTIHIWSDVLDGWICEFYGSTNDPYAATRRAIVRAAAEIGKVMK